MESIQSPVMKVAPEKDEKVVSPDDASVLVRENQPDVSRDEPIPSVPRESGAADQADTTTVTPPEIPRDEKKDELLQRINETIIAAVDSHKKIVDECFGKLLEAFEEKLKYDRFKEDQISRLHEELQSYKNDILSRITRPYVNSLIRLHDDIGKTLEALRKKDHSTLTPEKFFEVIEGFQEDVEIHLSHNGVEAFRDSGEDFDPKRQTLVSTELTDDPSKVEKIARRTRPGFEQNGLIVQKERVVVFAAAK